MKTISNVQDLEQMIKDGTYKFGDMLEFSKDLGNWEGPFKLIRIEIGKVFPPFRAANGVNYRYARLPRPELKLNDPIFTRRPGGCWRKKHFCDFGDDGGILAYDDGRTSWTSIVNQEVKSWPEWRIPTEDELKEWGLNPYWYEGRKGIIR